MNPTALLIAASTGAAVTASGWIAAWLQVRKTSAVKDKLRASQDHSADLGAKLLSAQTTIAKLEVIRDNPPTNSDVMQALADALNLLPVADAQRLRLQLYEARSGEGAGGDPEHVSGPSGPATIAELEDDEPG